MVLRTFEMSNFLLSHIFKMFYFYIKDFNLKNIYIQTRNSYKCSIYKIKFVRFICLSRFFFFYNDCVGQLWQFEKN